MYLIPCTASFIFGAFAIKNRYPLVKNEQHNRISSQMMGANSKHTLWKLNTLIHQTRLDSTLFNTMFWFLFFPLILLVGLYAWCVCVAVYHVANFFFALFVAISFPLSHSLVRLFAWVPWIGHLTSFFFVCPNDAFPSIYLSNSRNFSCLCMFYCTCIWCFIMCLYWHSSNWKWSVVWVIYGWDREKERKKVE